MGFELRLTAAALAIGLAACGPAREPPEAVDPQLLSDVRALIAANCISQDVPTGEGEGEDRAIPRDLDIADIDYGSDGWVRANVTNRGIRDFVYVRRRDAVVVCGSDSWYLERPFFETPQAYVEATGWTWQDQVAVSKDGGWQSRRIALQWEGYSEDFAGWIFARPGGEGGTIEALLPDGKGLCRGAYEQTSSASQAWTVSCANGLSASGHGMLHEAGQGASGLGTDSEGRMVTFTIVSPSPKSD